LIFVVIYLAKQNHILLGNYSYARISKFVKKSHFLNLEFQKSLFSVKKISNNLSALEASFAWQNTASKVTIFLALITPAAARVAASVVDPLRHRVKRMSVLF